MRAHVAMMTALPLVVAEILGMTVSKAACDQVLSSERPADTYVRNEIGPRAPELVSETYFLPLPRSCPRTPAGYSRWDLPCR